MKVKMSELDFDLAQVRIVKRRINQALKALVTIEKDIKKKKVVQREEWRDNHARRREKKSERSSAIPPVVPSP